MSRFKHRQENICLNCNTEIHGKFCHNCGQENLEPKESVGHLVSHFFQDITHFDGKFFSTVKYVLIRPGFLSKEYMLGRRASYVNPVRMYIFTSAFFFLIFFSFFKIDNKNMITTETSGKTYAQIEAMDSLAFDRFTRNINEHDGKPALPMSRAALKNYIDSAKEKEGFRFAPGDYNSKAEYDSALKSGKKVHNWWQRQLIYKNIEINEKYKNNMSEGMKAFSNILLHSLPQMFFILLPLFAGILKLLYIRRKDYYYVNHAIFSIHFYIFSFIAMLAIFALDKLNSELHWTFIKIAEIIIGFGIFFYLYKAMRNFYRQRRAKTVIKFLILCILLLITMMLLFLFFIFFSLFKL